MKKRIISLALMLNAALFLFPTGVAAIEPQLKTSEAFQESVYYQRLCAVEQTGSWRYDIAAVALAMVGYHEGDSKADYNGGNTQGWNNFTEFGQVYNGLDAQWCAMFVSWCARQAGIPKYAVNTAARAATDGKGGSTQYYFHIPFHEKANYTPETGDIVFFTSDGYNSSHVGVVVAVTETGLWTVEGNCINEVRLNYYDFDDAYIKGYGVYAAAEETESLTFDHAKLRFICTDGGHGSSPDGSEYKFDLLYALHGAELSVPEQAFVWEDHVLAGYYVRDTVSGQWYDGGSWDSGIPALLADGAAWSFSGEWMRHGSIELYCVWENSAGELICDSAMPVMEAEKGGAQAMPAFEDTPEAKWRRAYTQLCLSCGSVPDGCLLASSYLDDGGLFRLTLQVQLGIEKNIQMSRFLRESLRGLEDDGRYALTAEIDYFC